MYESNAAEMTRTSTDVVFDTLFEEISTLKLLPGAKISEAEVAARMGVSRQPVRDAFNRLGHMGLLLIRPQRATMVRAFSIDKIHNSRFVRAAVELEVVERACSVWDEAKSATLDANIALQVEAIEAGDTERFHALDYDFHFLICDLGGNPLAFETIETCKREVDRLCMLSLGDTEEVTAVLNDHKDIAKALAARSVKRARRATRHHLDRLDQTIAHIHSTHSKYFD